MPVESQIYLRRAQGASLPSVKRSSGSRRVVRTAINNANSASTSQRLFSAVPVDDEGCGGIFSWIARIFGRIFSCCFKPDLKERGSDSEELKEKLLRKNCKGAVKELVCIVKRYDSGYFKQHELSAYLPKTSREREKFLNAYIDRLTQGDFRAEKKFEKKEEEDSQISENRRQALQKENEELRRCNANNAIRFLTEDQPWMTKIDRNPSTYQEQADTVTSL